MRHLIVTASIFGSILLMPSHSHSEEISTSTSLKSIMSEQQYQDMGLDKLNHKERELLLQWVQGEELDNSSVGSEAIKGTAVGVADVNEAGQVSAESVAEFGFPDKAKQSEKLYANVKSPFRGWSGKTIFYLDNGQVWKQRVAGRYTYSGDDNRISISRNSWGFYELELLAADRRVGVTRIK